MEEDIMILESECYYLEELGYLKENNHFIRFNQALGNLIKRYKELEKNNNLSYNLGKTFMNEVWKSKIKEKIEELEKEKDETYTRFLASDRKEDRLSTKGKMTEGAIQALQELMEDK